MDGRVKWDEDALTKSKTKLDGILKGLFVPEMTYMCRVGHLVSTRSLIHSLGID